jgi:hypothetical protein
VQKPAVADTLSGKHHRAIAALLTEPTIGKAAQVAGISERTMYNWLSLPDFEAAYLMARRKAVQQAIARLQQVSTAAVAVLVGVMANEQAPAGTRVMAAKTVLEFSLRAVELEDITARIEALEAAQKGQR